jgi:hypothetical protein
MFSISLRCRDATRDSKIQPAATRLLSVNCLYQGLRKSARGYLNRATSLSNCLRFWSWVLLSSLASTESLRALGIWFFRPCGGSNFLDNAHSLGRGLHFFKDGKNPRSGRKNVCSLGEAEKTDRNDGLRALCDKCSIFTGTLGSFDIAVKIHSRE